MDAERFTGMSLGEVCGRIAGAVHNSEAFTPDAKVRIAEALSQAGAGLTGGLGSLLKYTPIVVTEYAEPKPLQAQAKASGAVPPEADQRPALSEREGDDGPAVADLVGPPRDAIGPAPPKPDAKPDAKPNK